MTRRRGESDPDATLLHPPCLAGNGGRQRRNTAAAGANHCCPDAATRIDRIAAAVGAGPAPVRDDRIRTHLHPTAASVAANLDPHGEDTMTARATTETAWEPNLGGSGRALLPNPGRWRRSPHRCSASASGAGAGQRRKQRRNHRMCRRTGRPDHTDRFAAAAAASVTDPAAHRRTAESAAAAAAAAAAAFGHILSPSLGKTVVTNASMTVMSHSSS
mmetsp:Transcript_32048/g.94303  ORF Transcript_32048/g.94303 Transcript_32048/m.94303 type:complete len:217 (-) Transcript_32048:135-785(-)